MSASTSSGWMDAFRGERLLVPALTLGFIGAAALTGLVVATGQPVLIALVVGSILGILLLGAVNVAVWMVLIGTLIVSGPTFMFLPQLQKAAWLFSLLGFFLLGVALLYPALSRNHPPGKMPGFVLAFWLFMLAGLISIGFSDGSLNEGITAAKRYFQFYGLMFLLAVVPFKTEQVRQWLKFLVIVAILHLPFALYQRLVVVPAWQYMNGVNGFVALDMVVGVFEGELGGGGSSSVLAFSCLLAMAYVLNSLREKLITPRRAFLTLLLVLAPLTLGETKVVVIWLPIMLGAIYIDQLRKHPIAFLFGAVLMAVMVIGFGWIYLELQATDGRTMSVAERFKESIEYNFGRAGYFGGRGLNRTTVLRYWWEHHGLADPIGTFFGHGLGSSYGAGERVALTGHMHNAHRGQGIGQTGIAAMLWDLGLLGTLLFYGALVSAALAALRLVHRAQPGFDRVLCRTLLGAMAVLCTIPFYTDQILQVPSLEVLAALLIGLVAWRLRNPIDAPPEPPKQPDAFPWMQAATAGAARAIPPMTPLGPMRPVSSAAQPTMPAAAPPVLPGRGRRVREPRVEPIMGDDTTTR